MMTCKVGGPFKASCVNDLLGNHHSSSIMQCHSKPGTQENLNRTGEQRKFDTWCSQTMTRAKKIKKGKRKKPGGVGGKR